MGVGWPWNRASRKETVLAAATLSSCWVAVRVFLGGTGLDSMSSVIVGGTVESWNGRSAFALSAGSMAGNVWDSRVSIVQDE